MVSLRPEADQSLSDCATTRSPSGQSSKVGVAEDDFAPALGGSGGKGLAHQFGKVRAAGEPPLQQWRRRRRG